jgi:anti-sigma factor RsiW
MVWANNSESVGLLLQRVADGQASDADHQRLSELLEREPPLMEELANLQQLSAVLGHELRRSDPSVDFRALQARVWQAVEAPVNKQPGGWRRFTGALWASLQVPRGLWAPLASVGVAVLLAAVLPSLSSDPAHAPGHAETTVMGPEIHSLETENSTPVVFQIPDSKVAVIWLAGVEPDFDNEEEDEAAPAAETPDEVEMATDGPMNMTLQ